MESKTKRPLFRLFTYLKNYRFQFWFSSTNAILNKIFDLMPPILTAWIIDAVSLNTPSWIENIFGIYKTESVIFFLGVLTAFILIMESFFEWLYKKGFLVLAQNVQHDMRVDAYDALQRREIAFFEKERTGNLMSILNNDINQLEQFLNTSFYQILHIITLFIFASISLFTVSPKLALIGLIPMPFIFIGSMYYQKLISPFYKTIRQKVGALSSRLENNISGIMVVKSFTAENFETERVRQASEEYKFSNYDAIRFNSLYVPLIRILITVGFVSVLMVGSFMIINQTGEITLGALAFFSMMIQRMLWPVTGLGRIFDEYERAKASALRVFDLMDGDSAIKDGQISLPKINGDIELKDVGFQYNNDQSVLKRINLNITAGETVGVAGTTGAGKTTLIKLLLRLYDTTTGQISIDNTSIKDLTLENLRQNIALVSQDVYLFHGTIEENIGYGMANASHEEIIKAAQKAELHEFVISLKEGYQTIVGERGIKLSGGQRQRLSIARAILKNAPILILDEATSSVDTETEKAIQMNLDELTQGRTAIVIAHRLSTIKKADKIIVLDQGTIVEQGSHHSLILQNGIYADLWKIQIGELVE